MMFVLYMYIHVYTWHIQMYSPTAKHFKSPNPLPHQSHIRVRATIFMAFPRGVYNITPNEIHN